MIKINNDGKEKWQSFTASVDISLRSASLQAAEYGATETEAVENLQKLIAEFLMQTEFDFGKRIYIDGMGNTITSKTELNGDKNE